MFNDEFVKELWLEYGWSKKLEDWVFKWNNIQRFEAGMLHHILRYFEPAKVLELGTGASTVVMADAISTYAKNGNSRLVSIDITPWRCRRSKKWLDQEGLGEERDPVTIINKSATDIQYVDTFDFAFIDSDHESPKYAQWYFRNVLPRCRIIMIHDFGWGEDINTYRMTPEELILAPMINREYNVFSNRQFIVNNIDWCRENNIPVFFDDKFKEDEHPQVSPKKGAYPFSVSRSIIIWRK